MIIDRKQDLLKVLGDDYEIDRFQSYKSKDKTIPFKAYTLEIKNTKTGQSVIFRQRYLIKPYSIFIDYEEKFFNYVTKMLINEGIMSYTSKSFEESLKYYKQLSLDLKIPL